MSLGNIFFFAYLQYFCLGSTMIGLAFLFLFSEGFLHVRACFLPENNSCTDILYCTLPNNCIWMQAHSSSHGRVWTIKVIKVTSKNNWDVCLAAALALMLLSPVPTNISQSSWWLSETGKSSDKPCSITMWRSFKLTSKITLLDIIKCILFIFQVSFNFWISQQDFANHNENHQSKYSFSLKLLGFEQNNTSHFSSKLFVKYFYNLKIDMVSSLPFW